jgi:hypothetical protein
VQIEFSIESFIEEGICERPIFDELFLDMRYLVLILCRLLETGRHFHGFVTSRWYHCFQGNPYRIQDTSKI